jgi:hypothetical protein
LVTRLTATLLTVKSLDAIEHKGRLSTGVLVPCGRHRTTQKS